MKRQKLHFYDLHSTRDEFASDVISGLSRRPATIPPKYFYDARGSELFDAITRLPEYYLTRTEIKILYDNADDIARYIGSGSLLVEPGGGSCAKVRILLEGLKPQAYIPMDISKEHLHVATQELATLFPWLEIHATCTDYSREMRLPPTVPRGTRVAFFPGSSIGNFDPIQAIDFLKALTQLIGPESYLLIGIDLKKNRSVLESAYDDSAKVTAQFNLNLLSRINHEFSANFNLDLWQHRALYNEELGRIEMHLVSTCEQSITLNNTLFHFSRGETIHTENSYKYTDEEFIHLANEAGFQSEAIWSDPEKLFSVHLFRS